MSEPCSFFLRVSIGKTQYLEFLQAKPGSPPVGDNWLKWWDSRQMSGKPELAGHIEAWDVPSNQDIIDGWLEAEDTLAFSEFDETTNVWEFGIIMCSENYYEILPLLVFCASVSPYKTPSPQDFGIIYPYFWGDSYVMAYMIFSEDGFALSLAESISDVAKNHLDYAESRLGDKWKALEGNMTFS